MKQSIRLIVVCGLVLASVTAAFSQAPTDAAWHEVTSKGGEFSIALPAGYLIHSDNQRPRTYLVGGAGHAAFDASFISTSKSDENMGWLHDGDVEKGKHFDYRIGKVQVHVIAYTGKATYKLSLAVATRKGFYGIGLLAPSANDPTLLKILASVTIDGQPVMKSTSGVVAPVGAARVDVGSLQSSKVVLEALKRTQARPITVELKPSKTVLEEEDDETLYSRMLMRVESPKARYTDEARTNNIRGAVKLRVLFKANGEIGRIRLVKGLQFGLNEQAVEAAKRIKFVPAEIDGKPVDTERNLVYTFTIY